ncbi:MAG TPA: pyrroloquinoline quinone-dependent dehydrogenase [Alphaproteobacteria bacterium]|nr:pyrroloquinoline quinone-dependent dehydrogenase [Alphaproteobacteria bacterium]
MMNGLRIALLALALAAPASLAAAQDQSKAAADWPVSGGTLWGQRYTALSDIDKDNVKKLKVAWIYHTGDFAAGDATHATTAFEAAPIEIEGTLYICTPNSHVIALDPESGQAKWTFDPKINQAGIYESVCRGVSFWRDTAAQAGAACRDRIFVGTMDARLIALDAATGKPCDGFGKDGTVDLKQGLGDVREGEYYPTSPPLVVEDLVLTNAFVKDGQRLHAPGGGVRAFDARTGELKWVWDSVPPSMTPVTADQVKQGATLSRGTPNSWGLLSADPKEGVVYVPTGNPSPDHYGGKERGDMDYYGSSIVALDLHTGAVKWHFQTVHHDLWDFDVGAQPVLYQSHGAAGDVPAVVGATKLGFLFLLNRDTGKPLFPVDEKPVPQTTVPGEHTSPTQPFPTKPAPLLPPLLTRDTVWGLTPIDRAECRRIFDSLDYQGPFTPPSLKGTLEMPGLGGGINWGSVSIDPVRNRMIVNMQVVPFTVKLVPRAEYNATPHSASDLVGVQPQEDTPYAAVRGAYMSSWGYPCVPHPWGKIAAIDLTTGDTIWEKPFGTLNTLTPKFAPKFIGGMFDWGTPNLGGSLQTSTGLVFIGATMDRYFHAIDGDTGRELWHYELPFAAQSTPVTYRVKPGGQQYIVIAAGGHGALGLESGDALVAFALGD